jgi:uncharacterized membrane protein YeaQ/YmgE (transglycosylase-associated protein family)
VEAFVMFIAGFIVWIVLAVVAGFLIRNFYRTDGTTFGLTLTFAFFGAFIGGMLGTSPYIHHDPTPMRFGALLGAGLGAFFFSFLYAFVARKAV